MSVVRKLTEGKLHKHLYQIALPIMGTSFIQMAYSFTDMAWLGRLNGKAVAAVGTVSVFLWIAQSLASFGKTASEVTLSQSIGRDDEAGAKRYAQHNFSLAFVLSVFFGLLFAYFTPELIDLYQLEPSVRASAIEYMHVLLWSFPALFLTSTLFGIYNAVGNSTIPFRVLSFGLILNIVLDPLFIHIFDWRVAGAAWATLISQCLAFLYFLWRIKIKDALFGGFRLLSFRFEQAKLWMIAKVGAPAALLNVLFAVVAIYMGRLASSIGGYVAVATLTTGGQLEALTWNTSQGVTTALSTIVGQNYAAGKLSRVFRVYRQALLFTFLVGMFGSFVFIVYGRELFALIVPERATYDVGAVYLRISGYSQIFMMLEITTQGLFYGLGRSYLPAVISIGGNYLRIPLALYLLSLGFGLSSVWWAISISSMIKGSVALVAYFFFKKRLLA